MKRKKKFRNAIKLEAGNALIARPLLEEHFFAASLTCFLQGVVGHPGLKGEQRGALVPVVMFPGQEGTQLVRSEIFGYV